MILFFVNFLNSFLPAALLAGTIIGLWWPSDGRRIVAPVVWVSVAGILAGTLIHVLAAGHGSTLESQTWLQVVSVFALCLAAATALFSMRRSPVPVAVRWTGTLFGVAVVSTAAAFAFFTTMRDEAFSVSSVLNTDFILNVTSLMVGILVILLLTAVIGHLTTMCGSVITHVFLVLIAALNSFNWTAEAMLAMLRLDMIEVTTERLSFVAKTTSSSYLFIYAQIGLVLVLAILFFIKRPPTESSGLAELPAPERRKVAARSLMEVRWFKAACACVVIMQAALLYYDLYASQPPSLSEAKSVKPDADGLIRIKVDDVKDGNLHRFYHITSDGTKVRFFLINRYKNHVKIGVVYDACMICGDMGYIQDGNEVICIACNVRMHIPSIGKPGGCNPIPFEFEEKDDTIVISTAELDRGANYFHERVEMEVQDPVTGAKLINLKAPHRYDYGGRTYFFESEKSLRQFQEDPEKFVKKKARHFRSQGWQSGT